jgi:hypothetical protein
MFSQSTREKIHRTPTMGVEGAIMQRQNCLLLFSTASRKQAYAAEHEWAYCHRRGRALIRRVPHRPHPAGVESIPALEK